MADGSNGRAETSTSGEPTSPYLPTFDTGAFSAPMPAAAPAAPPSSTLTLEPEPFVYPVFDPETGSSKAIPPVPPLAVPSTYQFLKRWVFALIVAAVWVIAVPIGAGLYHLWVADTNLDKTWSVFGVLVYLVVCTVAGLLVAMVQNRPRLAALAVALMSAPLASMVGAAVLYGAYVFGWIAR
ncbi:hypothetical protein A5757_11125 [Mycobacterium sp. 852013-51886_SCH5428379]|uniref:hypothetical protein n=1 Tax=Mycobacterium sp. 852013-51886_SCH5428379 TaxID=1834111 RepID=UPI000800EDB4|nr:hypothetical protein [Mycobacterium sp. 852013-51886_SCH5428379]OBB60206.1 hypothetical protein A5757_11125 [Mycobacterium sp. 852013-51886_SCH5428379]